MRRVARIAGISAAVCWLAFSSSRIFAMADVIDDVKAADSVVYQAIASRDADRLADLLDDAFVLTNTFGDVYDKASFIKACCSTDSDAKTLLLGATESDVKIHGNAAVVVARTEMRFTRNNQEEKLAWRSMRVYVKSGGKWKLAAEQRTAVD